MCPFLRSFVKIFLARQSGRVMVRQKSFLWVWTLIVGCLSTSCGGPRDKWLIPASSGRPYELLMVAEDSLWQAPAGQFLCRALQVPVPGLPQAEPSFRLMHASPEHFDAVLRLVRNILVVQVDKDKYPQTTFGVEKNVYASSQVIFRLGAPDETAVAEWAKEHSRYLTRFFTQAEMERAVQDLKENHSIEVLKQVQKQFGCEVWVPTALKASKTGSNFLWVSTNTATDDQNFVMYSYPYSTEAVFSKAGFVHKRDSVMKIHIPGARPGMYMTTDSLMTDVRHLRLRGTEVLEARGLWRVKGDFMGGPYVAHARVDTVRKCVVVAEVFVYAPNRSKRNLMRSLEASLYTWQGLNNDSKCNNINDKE